MNGSIGASLFYGVSCLIIYIAILLYPRKQKKEALITGLALSAVILESYIAFVGAIINILHIPVNLLSLGLVLLITAVFLLYSEN